MNQMRGSIFIGYLILIGLTGCIGLNKSSSRVSRNLYKTFFVNDSTELFYIKPITFKGPAESLVDFTIKKVSAQFAPVTVKISIIRDQPILPTSLALFAQGDTIVPASAELMFKEKHNKGYLYRYNLTLPYASVLLFFSAQDSAIIFDQFAIPATRKGAKTIGILNKDLFEFNLSPA